jgi:hypothetical protein
MSEKEDFKQFLRDEQIKINEALRVVKWRIKEEIKEKKAEDKIRKKNAAEPWRLLNRANGKPISESNPGKPMKARHYRKFLKKNWNTPGFKSPAGVPEKAKEKSKSKSKSKKDDDAIEEKEKVKEEDTKMAVDDGRLVKFVTEDGNWRKIDPDNIEMIDSKGKMYHPGYWDLYTMAIKRKKGEDDGFKFSKSFPPVATLIKWASNKEREEFREFDMANASSDEFLILLRQKYALQNDLEEVDLKSLYLSTSIAKLQKAYEKKYPEDYAESIEAKDIVEL